MQICYIGERNLKLKERIAKRQQELEDAFKTYGNTVFRIALSKTKNRTYADDILGEVFLKLTENIGKIKSEEHMKAWLIRVTINISNNYMKKLRFENITTDEEIPNLEDYSSKDVYSVVLSLPEGYRTAIHLFYYEDLSIKDISDILEQSESATKMQLKRGREKLKEILGDDYNVC